MLKSNWKKKFIAMLLIFTLTFADFALVGQSFAASIFDFMNDEGDTGSSNVEFDASFVITQEVTDDSEETSVTKAEALDVKADVNTESLSVKLDVKVSNSGYLKDSKIILGNGEDVNFVFDEGDLIADDIQSYENNEIELVQLNADSEFKITFPISFDGGSFIEEDQVSKANVIKFEGTYVDDDEETEVSKEITLNLEWQDNRETDVNSDVSKYIKYSADGKNGIILQVFVNTNNLTEEKTLPVKTSELEIEVPEINGVSPETVKVVASSLMGTSGKGADEVNFTEDNWEYNKEDGIVYINVENESQLVSLEDEDEVLIDETVEEVEAYYAASGTDEYLITYIYEDVDVENEVLNSSIISTYNMYGNTDLVSEEIATYALDEEIGDIVTFSMESNTEEISKAYTYLNYNNDNKYEIELDNKLIFNISYNDIVSGLYYEDGTNYYITDSGEAKEQDDVYYKSLKFNENNFTEILGENGSIKVSDNSGNEIATVNKNTKWDDGVYELKLDSVKGIKIETSKPVSEGNLVITATRAYRGTSFSKDEYKTFEKIQLNSVAKAKYTYLEEYVDCGIATLEIKLENTVTNANLELGQSSLSTLANNENVELKIELNNDKVISDVYGDSEFIIQMPEYIESVEITDSNIVYGEGLELSNVEVYEENGLQNIKVSLTGTQTALSSGIVSNGTNIVMNANIKTDLYAPATTRTVKMFYTNNEATVYDIEKDGIGYDEKQITYSAPTGVVSVNSISNYNDKNDTAVSINQGKVTADLDIYSEAKTATMEIIVMNNEQNDISNISILGRTIFEGNTNLLTGDDLGTTLTAPMKSEIKSDSSDFTIYYSTNELATNDLNDSSNGWTTSVSDLGSVKSYLIVPNDSEYVLDAAQKIRFSYEFEIPENLSHNEYLYGTFGTYYTNNSDLATTDEISVADLVELTTGIGPDISVTTSLSETEINEFEQFEYSVTVKNTGEVKAENITINISLPNSGISYSKRTSDIEDYEVTLNDDAVLYTISEIEIGKSATINTVFYVDVLQGISGDEAVSIDIYAEVTCDELGTTITPDPETILVNQAEMIVTVNDNLLIPEYIRSEGEEVELEIEIEKLVSTDFTNVVVTMQLDDAFTFEKGTIIDSETGEEEEIATYDLSTRTITWKLDLINLTYTRLYVYFTVNEMTGSQLMQTISISATVKADETETYRSEELDLDIGKASLIVTQKTNTLNSYVTEGDLIEYVFTIENEGVVATSFRLEDEVPEGLIVRNVSYESDGYTVSNNMTETDVASVSLKVEPGETKTVTVQAYAQSLNGASELSVTNTGTVTQDDTGETIQSNSITHIIENEWSTSSSIDDRSTGTSSSLTSGSTITKTYNITGIAWIDENANGARDDGEKLVKDVTATLVNSDTGVITQNAVTNSNGEYKFSGVNNGNYIVLFDYDTTLYTVTTYQKENVASNLNSDVITTQIEQNGEYRNGAVSCVVIIDGSSVSNIDIGLIEGIKFDLSMDMRVSKITVQNSRGTNSTEYDMATYTKTEISQRYISGSEIYVEYTLAVTNEGDIEGYATQLVDYIPNGMNFNSSMNSDWYTGSDGNLYTTGLSNTKIAPGETKTITLVLSKTMTSENTGTVSNTAEIAADYNIYGISDYDSTPGNNNQSEDDFARADSILSVGTGGVYVYISIGIVIALLIGTTIIITRVRKKKNENNVNVDLEGGV